MPQGRPKTVRIGGTGEKLYMALKLTGLSWGTRVGPNHIAANPRWRQCGLPRSINTVIEDIRSGIPIQRLERYASFFRVAPELFANETVGPYSTDFSCEILKNKNRQPTFDALEASALDVQARKHIQERNGVAANYSLYQLLFGVYKLFYKRRTANVLYQGVARTETQTDCGIGIAGILVVEGIPVDISGILFRWNNFIHIQYHSGDYQILGYMIGPDPMDSVLARRRQPFFMKLQGLAGSLEPTTAPDRYEILAVKQVPAEGVGLTQTFDAVLDSVVREQALVPDDAAYARAERLFGAAG